MSPKTVLCTIAAAAASLVAAAPTQLQNILDNTHGSDAYRYPTDFTRGIIPKNIHSHNDYWRDVPFYSALAVGAISIEADVWLKDGTLYVGHERSALTSKRTLQSLYLDPIADVLARQNPNSSFVDDETRNGLYDASSGQTVYLFIDLKTSAAETFPAVVEALKPLNDAGWLTTFDGEFLDERPITVIGTGNTRQSDVEALTPRYVYFDGPIATLASTNLTNGTSPIVSGSFNRAVGGAPRDGVLNEEQLRTIREQVEEAQRRGIKTRYWETPLQPVSTRNKVWASLWTEGVDLINVDDLQGAAKFWETYD